MRTYHHALTTLMGCLLLVSVTFLIGLLTDAQDNMSQLNAFAFFGVTAFYCAHALYELLFKKGFNAARIEPFDPTMHRIFTALFMVVLISAVIILSFTVPAGVTNPFGVMLTFAAAVCAYVALHILVRDLYQINISLSARKNITQDAAHDTDGSQEAQAAAAQRRFQADEDARIRHFRAHFMRYPYRESGYVYVIRDCDVTGYCKIGMTKLPRKRLTEFGAKMPFSFDILYIIPCVDARKTEHALHQAFARQRMRGEWFNLSDDDMRALDAHMRALAQAVRS